MSLTPLPLDVQFVANRPGELHLSFRLHNPWQRPVHQGVLHLEIPRAMQGQQTINAQFIKQEGAHIELGMPSDLAAGDHWHFELRSQHARLFNVAELPCGIYLECNEQLLPVQLRAHDLPQPEPIDNLVIALPEPQPGIVPEPRNQQPLSGHFALGQPWRVTEMNGAARWLQSYQDVHVNDQPNLHFVHDEQLAPEAYRLSIQPDGVWVQSASAAGELYALVSLLQLVQQAGTQLQAQVIDDQPRFGYRGQMLDCSRHFHAIETIKELLEQMTWLKLNRFHWHLTDDEGWRLALNCYPELTDIGAWRGPGLPLSSQFGSGSGRYGGFYSQEEVRDVLAFAADRQIMVIPEIDIPGHARALIKSLPHLLQEPDDRSEYLSIQQYRDNVLNPGLDTTYRVLENILAEVAELFPAPYIHLGADEVPEGVWLASPACQAKAASLGLSSVRDLQGVLLRHLQDFLRAKGKRLVGWEEAIEGDKLAKDASLCSWRGVEAGIKAANAGYPVIMCPAQFTYFDLAWNNDIHEYGVLWAGPLNLKTSYEYEPLNQDLTPEGQRCILGVQSQLWSESVERPEQVHYLLFPRLLATAETGWSQHKDWPRFLSRLPYQLSRLSSQGIHYRPSFS